MELIEAIKGRRSIRKFTDQELSRELVQELLDTAVWAPSASNVQPWGFVVIEDKAYLKEVSDQAKKEVLIRMNDVPQMEQYRSNLENPDFNIFYNAPALIVIYGKADHFHTDHDCAMVAQTLLLSAWEKGLGGCWIGFAQGICGSAEFMEKHKVPAGYKMVAPLIIGYPAYKPSQPVPRKEYPLFDWKE